MHGNPGHGKTTLVTFNVECTEFPVTVKLHLITFNVDFAECTEFPIAVKLHWLN